LRQHKPASSPRAFETYEPKGYIYFAMAFSLAVEMINNTRAAAPKMLQRKSP
jgi:hypothetical protein